MYMVILREGSRVQNIFYCLCYHSKKINILFVALLLIDVYYVVAGQYYAEFDTAF